MLEKAGAPIRNGQWGDCPTKPKIVGEHPIVEFCRQHMLDNMTPLFGKGKQADIGPNAPITYESTGSKPSYPLLFPGRS
jgi:hypothetical protein